MNLQAPSSTDIEPGPGEVGSILRASRLRQGQELSDVARALRIRIVYLQAIEDSRYQDLPGLVYAIGFIRSYADHLGLDGEQLVTRFKTEASGQGRKPIMTYAPIVAEGGVPRGAIITIGAAILIAAYGGWYVLSSKNLYVTDLIPPVPESISRAFEAGRTNVVNSVEAARTKIDSTPSVATARPAPAETMQSPPAAAPAVESPPASLPAPATAPAPPSTPAPAVQPSSPAPVPTVPAATPAAVPTPPAESAAAADADEEVERTPPPSAAVSTGSAEATFAAAAAAAPREATPVALDDRGGVDAPAVGSQLASLPAVAADPGREIVLKATVDSWIQVRDTNENRLVLTRLLRKGEQYTVPPQPGLSLVTGNAGGLEVTVGGVAIPSLGPIGEVRRNIVLDPDRLRAGTAIRE